LIVLEGRAPTRDIMMTGRKSFQPQVTGDSKPPARLILSEHDIEPEETAQKGAIADVPAILDEKEQKDIQAINRALARTEPEECGSCEVCGKGIEAERLLGNSMDECFQTAKAICVEVFSKAKAGDRDAVKWFESFERETGLTQCRYGLD